MRPLLTSFLAMQIAACGGGPSGTTPTTPAAVDTTAAALSAVPTARFGIEALPEADGIPRSSISVQVDGKSEHLADISGTAALIPTDGYAAQGIPVAAIEACGAWWAGAGSYYYLILEAGRPALYEGWSDEAQADTGHHWKKSRTW